MMSMLTLQGPCKDLERRNPKARGPDRQVCVSLFPWAQPITSGMTEPGLEGAKVPAGVVSAEFV